MTLQQSLPYILPLIVVGILFLRVRPGTERHLKPAQLWIMPVVAGGMIAFGLYFSPHPDLTPLHVAILIAAVGAGIATGMARAHTVSLRRDGDRIMAKTSSFAFLLLVALVLIRQSARSYFATSGGALAIDASMLFALGMIITQRLTMWRRCKALSA
jgi:membrane protein CcdC involved in cytochrome C biogenesis